MILYHCNSCENEWKVDDNSEIVSIWKCELCESMDFDRTSVDIEVEDGKEGQKSYIK